MFKENSKAIYLQIAERIYDAVLAGELHPADRLPSVRDYAIMVQVNPNTVMRTYDVLSRQDIIVNRRGIGYFLADDAPEKVRLLRSRQLLDEDIVEVFRQCSLLGITPQQIADSYNDYLNKRKKQ